MKREIFLTIASIIALLIGFFATIFPSVLLESKGVVDSEVTNVWMQQVGILLIAIGILVFLVRKHNESPTLKAILISNIIIQIGLLIIEIVAYYQGIIPLLSGIIPNSIIHIILAFGFGYYLLKFKKDNS